MHNTTPPSPSLGTTDRALRPTSLADYVGQPRVQAQLTVFLAAARARQESLDHVLISGPPGLGKTTLAHIIAHEMGVGLRQTSGPVLERPGDLAALLVSLEPNDVLFIDEIHRLPIVVEEILYPAMEDGHLDLMVGEGAEARSVQVSLEPFTLVGATTRAGMLSKPLHDRFGITARLEFYSAEDLASIVQRSAHLLGFPLNPEGALAIAQRSRGTPRIANRLLRRARDVAQTRNEPGIDVVSVDQALDLLDVDQAGLDTMDRRFLKALAQGFNGGPVGIESLASAVGEDRGTLEDSLEPYLLQQGLVQRTPRGRVLTPAGWRHLGLSGPTT